MDGSLTTASLSRTWGRSTNDESLTTVDRLVFADGWVVMVEVSLGTDYHYEPQNRGTVRAMRPEDPTWIREPLIERHGRELQKIWGHFEDRREGRLDHTFRVLREEGDQHPVDTLKRRAMDEQVGQLLMDAVDIYEAVHGPLVV